MIVSVAETPSWGFAMIYFVTMLSASRAVGTLADDISGRGFSAWACAAVARSTTIAIINPFFISFPPAEQIAFYPQCREYTTVVERDKR
jgi:hypothetical protein